MDVKEDIMKGLWSIFFSFSRMRGKFLRLKDTEEGEDSVRFGVKGIVYALLSAAMLVLSYFAFQMTFSGDWTVVLGFILLVIGAGGALLFFLHGIYSTLLQMKLNRKAVGFLSLIFQIAVIAAAIVVVLAVNKIAV